MEHAQGFRQKVLTYECNVNHAPGVTLQFITFLSIACISQISYLCYYLYKQGFLKVSLVVYVQCAGFKYSLNEHDFASNVTYACVRQVCETIGPASGSRYMA